VKSPDWPPAAHEYTGDSDVCVNVPPPEDGSDATPYTTGAPRSPATSTSADNQPDALTDPASVCT
jgi:hypothetical protein